MGSWCKQCANGERLMNVERQRSVNAGAILTTNIRWITLFLSCVCINFTCVEGILQTYYIVINVKSSKNKLIVDEVFFGTNGVCEIIAVSKNCLF